MNIKAMQQNGFTLIELVIVIVVIGILSAVIYPKYQDLTSSAYRAVLDGAIAAGNSAAVVGLAKNGVYPAAAAICGLIQTSSGASCDGTTGEIKVTGASSTCTATYSATTGLYTANATPAAPC